MSSRRPGPGKARGSPSTKDADEELARLFLASVLRAPVAVHRHAVVIATDGQLGLHTAVDLRLMPSQAPDLDECIDGLWVIASQNLPARCCYWARQHGWATAVLAS